MKYLVKNGVINVCMKFLHQEIAKYEMSLQQLEARGTKQRNPFQPETSELLNLKEGDLRNYTKQAMLQMTNNIYRPCLRFLGNLLSGDDELTEAVIRSGYLDVIYPFTIHFLSNQRREIMWALSNIMAGSHHQIEAIISRPKLIQTIVSAASSDQQQVRREACYALCNATVDSISEQKKKLADYGAIEALCNMLKPRAGHMATK
eukprot:TRINITY_DN3629_c0_g1_i2.p1 TRINITY_DN3629_c0_g1~~TRINITY_DN3629_c0_g1_i2.p1  ORF type:complete len:225 (+),score=23.24 TRINITY_DN3629_c0_g1_i2:65-676(+)